MKEQLPSVGKALSLVSKPEREQMGWQRGGGEKGTEENAFGEMAVETVQHCRINSRALCA